MTNPTILALQAQLASLQNPAQSTPISSVPSMTAPGMASPIPDIDNIVIKIIEREYPGIKDLLAASSQLQQKQPKELSILEAIGLALTGEEQVWLSKPEVLKQIPGFLASVEGKDITKLFFTSFKDYHENSSSH